MKNYFSYTHSTLFNSNIIPGLEHFISRALISYQVFYKEFKTYLWKVVLGMLFYFVETKLILVIVLLTVILKI